METSTYLASSHHQAPEGTVTYFKGDGLYYFQFNGKEGQPVLYSRGYATEWNRDSGIELVQSLLQQTRQLEFRQTLNGQHYFILKSDDHQAIARSKIFGSREEMMEQLAFLKTRQTASSVQTEVEETPPPSPNEAEPTPSDSLGMEIEENSSERLPSEDEAQKSVESQPATTNATEPTTQHRQYGSDKDIPEKMPRYKFSIIYYPDSPIWQIKHDQSGDSREFKTYDSALITSFIMKHAPESVLPAKPIPPAKQPETSKAGAFQPQSPPSPSLHLQFRKYDRQPAGAFAKALDLSLVETSPKNGEFTAEQTYSGRVTAKSLTSGHEEIIGEIQNQRPQNGQVILPIYRANGLSKGLYRFFVHLEVQQGSSSEGQLRGDQLLSLK